MPYPAGSSCWRGWRAPPGDQRQDVRERLSWYRDFGHLAGHVSAMADDLRADLDQLFAQAGQRPHPYRLGHCQSAHEIADVIGQSMELNAHGIGGEGTA